MGFNSAFRGLKVKARDTRRRITAAGTKYMRKTAGYTWTDCETNREIARELIWPQSWTKCRNTEEIGYDV
jgi:hypothetical protein